MAKNPHWIKCNFNIYGKNINDCAIRAVSAATGLDYRVVCKKFGVACVKGKGLRRDSGINLNDIEKTFSDYFDIIEDYYDNYDFVPNEFKDSAANDEIVAFDLKNNIDAVSNDTLNDFCSMFAGQGMFIVSLESDPKSKDPMINRPGGHIVCVNLCRYAKKQGFIDTWDSGGMRVDAYMRVVKQEPKDSPLHWKYDNQHKQFIEHKLPADILKEDMYQLKQLNEMNDKAQKLCELMKKGIVEFIFKKKSTGKLRRAKGTLKRDLIPPEAQRKKGRPKKRPDDLVIYYDVGKKAIRSFKDYLLKQVFKTKSKKPDISKEKENINSIDKKNDDNKKNDDKKD